MKAKSPERSNILKKFSQILKVSQCVCMCVCACYFLLSFCNRCFIGIYRIALRILHEDVFPSGSGSFGHEVVML